MKKNMCIIWTAPTNRLTPGCGKDGPPTWGKDGPLAVFLPHIFPGLMIAVYFVAYNVE